MLVSELLVLSYGVTPLVDAFNADATNVRILALTSPT